MKLNRYTFLFIGIMLLLTGCIKSRFKLVFNLPETVNNAYSLVYYASDSKKGWYVETAASVQKGKCEMELPMRNPSLIYLSNGNNGIWIYVRRGDKIEITGTRAEMEVWDVGGNELNKEWSSWRKENLAAVKSGDYKKINSAIAKFVKKNQEEPLSSLLLLLQYNRRENEAEFQKLWASLKGDAASEEWLLLVSRNDMLTSTPTKRYNSEEIRTIVVKSFDNGADTIQLGKTPVVLYCWRNSDEGRKEAIDSLKHLRQLHPDSTKFVIVDICFDPDSTSWAMPLRRDSLKHTIRAWTPLGEVDPTIKSLGIERTPTFVTYGIHNKKKGTGKKGK